MKTIGITVKLQVEVEDEVAERLKAAPGFITVGGGDAKRDVRPSILPLFGKNEISKSTLQE